MSSSEPRSTTEIDEHITQTVLLVDDDARLIRGLVRTLADEPYRILTAVSSAEANVILAQQCVDLVLSDNLMSGTLGTEFLKQVRHEWPSIKLMMLSGFMPTAVANRMICEIGVIQVLTKPCEASQVVDAIRAALEQSAS